MVPKLTPRLMAVAEQVPQGARLADVGTDHAYLPVWLLAHGRIPGAVATDVRPGPLERAAVNVKRFALADRVELRLCDGLAAVRSAEVDAVVIAGMGGETILNILSRAPWALEKTCVVQPMASVEDLRRGLGAIGGHILSERLTEEGRALYISMVLGAGAASPLTPGECWVGQPALHRGDPLWPRYFAKERDRAEQELAGLRRSRRPTDEDRRAYLEAVAAELEKLGAAQER